MDGQVRDGLQGSKVSLLPLRLREVAGAVGDLSSEVAYPAYLVLRQRSCASLLTSSQR